MSRLIRTVLVGTILVSLNALQPAFAADSRSVHIKPPVGTATGAAEMNQGWHSPENGIDWDDDDSAGGTCCNIGRNYFFIGWAYRSSSTAIKIAYMDFYQSNVSNCMRGAARLSKYENDSTILGYLLYRHAATTKLTNMQIWASSAGENNQLHLGVMQASQQSWETCGWTGAHVHAGSSSFTLRVGSAPGAIPNSPAHYTYNDPHLESAVTERYRSWSV